MKNGSKACPYCFSHFTFEEFELVDSKPADQPCEGCVRLYATLAESARRKVALAKRKVGMLVAEPPVDAVDLSTPSSILARLLANRRRAAEPEPFDARMAAAEGRD